VLAKIAENKVLICGTNAYKPLCRHYHFKVSSPLLYSGSVSSRYLSNTFMEAAIVNCELFNLAAESIPEVDGMQSSNCNFESPLRPCFHANS
jgi:hypothetical protein